MPVGSKLRRLLQGQRQKISHPHSRLGLQMDPHPLPVLEESNSLQRRQIPGDPQEKRFHFCHPPSPKIILRIIMKSIDGGAQGTRSASDCKGSMEYTGASSCVRGRCEPRTARGPFALLRRAREAPEKTICFCHALLYPTIRPMKPGELFDLSGQVAVVVGATGALGGALADGLAEAGAKVAVLGRDAARGAARVKNVQSRGGQAAFFAVDAVNKESLQEAHQAI